MGKKIIIVGGVAGGATVAARLRRLDENSRIVILNGESTFLLLIAVYLIM